MAHEPDQEPKKMQYPLDSTAYKILDQNDESKDDSIVKKVRFGGETIIQDQKEVSSTESSQGSQGQAMEVGGDGTEECMSGDQMIANSGDQGIDRDAFVEGLMALRSSLNVQRQEVSNLIGMLAGGEMTREENLMQQNEALATELVNEKKKNLQLEMELEFLKLLISSASNDHQGGSADI